MITDIAISFVNTTTVRFTNSSGSAITLTIQKFNGDGTFTNVTDELIAPANSYIDYVIADGLYNVFNNADTVHIVTFFTYGAVLAHLDTQAAAVLAIVDEVAILPFGYDFVTLALLSILFVGNATYQIADYNISNATSYNALATAINNCSNYLDNLSNTPQSTTAIWVR